MTLLSSGLVWLLITSGAALADPKDDARRHFALGLDHAQEQDFQGALDEFLAAQAAWPHPASLYNIARSYTDLGRLPEAIDYYRLYAAAAPEKSADVAPVLAVLEARLRAPLSQSNAILPDATPADAPAQTNPPSLATSDPAARSDALRLAAIAAELADLSARLSAVPTAVSPSIAAPPTAVATDPVALPSPEPLPAGTLMADAYERVVITASRYGQSPLESPSTVTVLTEDDIRLSGAVSIPDLLRRVPGVDVMELSAGQPDVSIRGFNRELSNKVLVLVDGRSVYLDFLGTVLWSSLPLAIDEVERIEIIRGPGSAIYGANAMTGVINIITRVPGEGRTLVRVGAGSAGYLQGTALADGRHESTAWRLSAGWAQLGRWQTEADPAAHSSLVPLLEDADTAMSVARASGRVDKVFLDRGLASLSGGWAQGTTEFYALGALGDYGMRFDSGFGRVDLAYGPVHLRGFYNGMGGPIGPWTEYAGQRSLDSRFDSDTADVELEALGDLDTGTVHHRVNAGAGYRFKRITWDYLVGDGEPIVEHHLDAFVQEQAQVGRLTLLASVRADKHPLVPIQKTLSPRGAAIVRVGEATSVRVTGGTAFRTPAFIESYLDLNQPTEADGVYVRTLGDPTLSPERIYTAELGAHDESSAVHQADVAVYVNRVTDLIGLTDVEPEVAFFDPDAGGFSAGSTGFTNLPQVYTALGAEGELRVFPVDGFDVYGSFALERITEAEDGVVVVDGSTSLVKLNGGVMYRSPIRIDLAAHISYVSGQTWRLRDFDEAGNLIVSEQAIPGRTVMSAKLAGRPFADNALELSVSGWNLLALGGSGFQEHPKGQRVGSRVWGEVAWSF